MRGNIVAAAAIFGGALVLASIIFIAGIYFAFDHAAGRLSSSIEAHARLTSEAGERAGAPIAAALQQVNGTIARHADAVVAAGQAVGHPVVRMQDAVPIVDQQPLRIQGTVGVEVGENKESKKGAK